MTVLASPAGLTGDSPESRASPDELLKLASGDDFARWERQLAATGNCANPVRLRGRIDAIDRATGEIANIYDAASEPGAVLRIPCGNRREHICPACSKVYKGDARQIIRSGLTGGKGIPDSVAQHPCVFAMLTAPGFGPVHTIRTGRRGRRLACRQLERVRGELQLGPVKTYAGQRALPLLDLAQQALAAQADRQARYRADMGSAWKDTDLVFTTRTGRPVEPYASRHTSTGLRNLTAGCPGPSTSQKY